MIEPAAAKDKTPTKSWILENKGKLLGGVFFVSFAIFLGTLSHKKAATIRAVDHLRTIGLASINYSAGAASNLPFGGITDSTGNPQHGWMTAILPYMERRGLAELIHYDQPWTAPENERVFKTIVPAYLNPGIHEPITTPNGYALSHYAANSQLIGINKNSNLTTIAAAGRISNTILMGEINANFPAWGSANNMRDPAKGLNGGPDCFGSPSGEGAVVIFVDGSGKFLNKNINPAILKAISNPAGRGPVPPNGF